MKKYHRYLLLTALSLMTLGANAQFHDENVMQQFIFMETGGGSLNPRWYYNAFHKSYSNNNPQYVGGKLAYRAKFDGDINKELTDAKTIDTLAVSRAKSEAQHIASRTDKAIDLAWSSEGGRIEKAQSNFMRNISKITMYGGSYNSQKVWENIYDCFDMAIKETKSAYLDAGARKREYFAIYNDIVKHNVELTKYLRILAGSETAEQFFKDKKEYRPVKKRQGIAYDAFERWKSAASAGGFSTRKNRK